MIGVVVKEITARLQYTMDFVFAERGVPYKLILENEVANFSGSLISYGLKLNDTVPSFSASKLLFEEDVRSIVVEKSELNGLELLSFDGREDLFASIFYVLSRYEEYLSTAYDIHGRFPAKASLFFQFEWLDKSMCDRWSEYVLQSVGQKAEHPFRIVPTFDIDNTFAYRFKTGSRASLSFLKDLKNGDFERIRERRAVLKGAHDPYDTFDDIHEILDRFPEGRIFWLVAPLGKKDRNLSSELKVHQDLMRRMDFQQTVGLHPGYVSNGNEEKIRKEKQILEKALGREVQASRQHFLRFRLPETYRALSACGFTDEYSMGFAETPGFRAGTARTFHWFDLSANSKTNLRVHPFVYMDGTLNEYLELSIEDSKEQIHLLFEEVKRYGGDFVFIWHNETIGEYGKWKGWRDVLNFTLNLNE